MKRNKDVYDNFVCPYCWNTLDNCTCELFPPYHTIFIDKNIQEHIKLLNMKKYNTTACCEGHIEGCGSTYISFANNYNIENSIPNGFKYDKNKRMIYYNYSRKLSEEEMEKLKKEKLSVLLDWCKSLPSKKE